MSLAGRRVLVTGGTGSLGQVIVRRILPEAASVTVFSRDEAKQHEMLREFPARPGGVTYRTGDIGDYHAVVGALRNTDVVIHCAAMKHVPACEKAPLQAIRTNITGAENIVRAICDLGLPVESLVFVSTDKAIEPSSLYGMTKAVMERIFIQANDECDTRFVGVRLGNILSSRGSVVPLFHSQIKAGGPVTVTDPEMTRFVMPIDEACDAVLYAIDEPRGEIYVPFLHSVRILQLAKVLIGQRDIGIDFIGPRPGERNAESMVLEDGQVVRSDVAPLPILGIQLLLRSAGLLLEDEPVFS